MKALFKWLQENKLIDWTRFYLQWNYLKSLQKYLSSSQMFSGGVSWCPAGFSTLTVCVFSNCLVLILLTSSRTCGHSRVHSWWWCWWWHWLVQWWLLTMVSDLNNNDCDDVWLHHDELHHLASDHDDAALDQLTKCQLHHHLHH